MKVQKHENKPGIEEVVSEDALTHSLSFTAIFPLTLKKRKKGKDRERRKLPQQ